MAARDDAEVYYFDIVGERNERYAPFRHDYKPQLEPIKAVFPQDLPDRIKRFHPSFKDLVVDPYLPIARLRRQFEGKGRKLGGYLILLHSLYSKRHANKRPVRISESTPFSDLQMMEEGTVGMHSYYLPEVHPIALMHLNIGVGIYERRSYYWSAIFDTEREIREARDERKREDLQRRLEFSKTCMDLDKGQPTRKAVKRYFNDFPLPEQRRMVMMPDNVVVVPPEGQLDWVDMERAIKRLIEDRMQQGRYAITNIFVYACDMAGGFTLGIGEEKETVSTKWALALSANMSYHAGLVWAINDVVQWMGGTDKADELNRFLIDRYSFSLDAYYAREHTRELWYGRYLPEDMWENTVLYFRRARKEAEKAGKWKVIPDMRVW